MTFTTLLSPLPFVLLLTSVTAGCGAVATNASGDAADAAAVATLGPDARDTSLTDAGASVDEGTHAGDASVTDALAAADEGSDARDASATDTPVVTDGGSTSAEFQTIYDTILRPRCVGCHTDGSSRSSSLHMPDAPTAFANLVNTRVTCSNVGGIADGEIRVVPSDPAASVIMQVRTDLCGLRHGNSLSITDAELATIGAWINSGAR